MYSGVRSDIQYGRLVKPFWSFGFGTGLAELRFLLYLHHTVGFAK